MQRSPHGNGARCFGRDRAVLSDSGGLRVGRCPENGAVSRLSGNGRRQRKRQPGLQPGGSLVTVGRYRHLFRCPVNRHGTTVAVPAFRGGHRHLCRTDSNPFHDTAVGIFKRQDIFLPLFDRKQNRFHGGIGRQNRII